jgi:hypothetical protein
MKSNRIYGLAITLSLALLLVLATFYSVQADPQRHPFKWPDGKELKICFQGDFWNVTARKENARKAMDEWLNPDDHPAAGEKLTSGSDKGKTNPNNDSVDDMMEEGDEWDLDNFRWPKVNRSFSKAEKKAMKDAHGGNLPTWTEVDDCAKADIVFGAKDLGKGHLGSTTTTYGTESKTKKKSEVTVDSDPDQGDGETWHHARDGDGDGKITNNDNNYETGVHGKQIDLYSVLKHEIGHALSFAHATVVDERPQNTEQSGETAGEDDLRTIEINPPPESLPPNTPNTQRTGSQGDEQLADHYTRLYFASDFGGYPGGPGLGGMDLWRAEWDFDNTLWISVTNLGGGVNSPDDEITPFVGEDGTLLVFSRGTAGLPNTFDLLMSTWDITSSAWLPAMPLPMLGFDPAAADEVAPSLSHDWTLLFASDISGTFDLWQSEFDPNSGQWLTPTLLPGLVNSPGADEVDPMLDSHGNLLFASDRADGFGLFDIWFSEMAAGQWQTPTNLVQVNSFCDERDPYPASDGDALYYSSNVSMTLGGPICAPLNYDVRIADNLAPVVRVDDDLDPVAPGSVETYTLYYEDTRPIFDPPIPVGAVVLSATYPAHSRFLGSDPAPEAGMDNVWGIGDLFPGQSGRVTVTLWISDTASQAPRETTPGLEHLGVLEMQVEILYMNPFGGPESYRAMDRTWVQNYTIYLPLVQKNH